MLLLEKLCDAGFEVSLETPGALDIAAVDSRVSRVVDIKTPGSGEAHRNHWPNLTLLTPNDQIKFVLCSRVDYEWARTCVAEHELERRCMVWFSPSKQDIAPTLLADWIISDRLEYASSCNYTSCYGTTSRDAEVIHYSFWKLQNTPIPTTTA